MIKELVNWIKQNISSHFIRLIFSRILENKLEAAIVFLILTTAAFLRLWRIDDYMTFLGDEGRDAIVVKNLITKGDPILIGPPTSIGNMYLGPIYYYMMAPFLALSRLSPVGPAVMVALIGIITVFLIYVITREWFGKVAGLAASALYTVSPVVIFASRSSWNPNPAPFFSLITIYSLYQILANRQIWWMAIGAVSLAAALQMHYLATLLLPTFGIFWLAGFLKYRKEFLKKYLIWSLFSVICFLLLMSPLLWFDLRHDFLNYKAFIKFFTERQTTLNINPVNFLERIFPLYHSFFARFLVIGDQLLGILVTVFVSLGLMFSWWRIFQSKKINWPIGLLTVWVLVGIVGLASYKLTVFDHYFGFLNPAAFILFGLVTAGVWRFNFLGRLTISILVLGIIILNLLQTPIAKTPNKQLEKTQKIAQIVIDQTDGAPYNFALIAKNNYDAAYQYYLDLLGHKPKQVDFVQTEQLFVVCEDEECNPVGHPKSEIARFGFAKVEKRWNISGIKLFKLVKNPGGRPQAEMPPEEKISL